MKKSQKISLKELLKKGCRILFQFPDRIILVNPKDGGRMFYDPKKERIIKIFEWEKLKSPYAF